jgi:dipeptidase E
MKGIFAGSGNASMSNPYIASAVIDLTQRRPEELSLLYIGTASYDIAKFRHMQTKTFKKMGVTVKSLNVANRAVPRRGMEQALDEADIILVSGGNTLFAVDRWEYLGLSDLLRDAALSGKVMAGGSAGAICWFDGGHSDSMDPETYRTCMLNKFGEDQTIEMNPAESNSGKGSSGRSKSKSPYDVVEEGETDVEMDDESTSSSEWEYIRVEGLGIMPGTFHRWMRSLSPHCCLVDCS